MLDRPTAFRQSVDLSIIRERFTRDGAARVSASVFKCQIDSC